MQAYSGETGQEHAPAGLVGEEPVGTRHGVLERLAPLGKVGLAGGLILFLFFCRTSQFVEGDLGSPTISAATTALASASPAEASITVRNPATKDSSMARSIRCSVPAPTPSGASAAPRSAFAVSIAFLTSPGISILSMRLSRLAENVP